MNIFRFSEPSSRDRLASKVSSSRQGKKQSRKLKSPRSSSSSEFHSCHCEALSQNNLQQDSAPRTTGLPMKSLLAQEMSKQKETKRRSPSIIARLMGLDVLPPQISSHRQHKSVESQQGMSGGGTSSYDGCESLRRSSKGEQKFKDVFEVLDAKKAERSSRDLYHQGRVDAANLTQAEMAFIRQKFMEAKRLSSDEKLRHSKEFNDALEALDSNKDLLLKFLQQPDSLFTKHVHDLQSAPHKPRYSQAPSLKCLSHPQKVDRDSLRKSHRSPHRHGGGDGCPSHSHSRHASYETLDLPNVEQGKRNEQQPTKIVVLKPKFGGRAFASPSSSSDEFRADRRLLPCTSNHGRQKSNEDIRLSRQSSKDSGEFSKIMSRQRKASFETSGFRGYAGDESSSGSDSASESELVPVTSRTRTAFNRKNHHHRSLPSKSTSSSVSREAKRRLSERWKLTHKYEQEIEISRSGTLADMLATSDKEARPASFNGLIFEEGISKRVERNAHLPELPEPVGISSRDGWKGSRSRSYSKSKTIMNQESTGGYTIVLPKELITRDGLVMGSSFHHSFLSSKSSRHGSNRSHSSYNSSPEINIGPSLTKSLYVNEVIHQKEKLSPSKTGCSFSVDANSETEDSSASDDDIKTAMSSEAPDLSTVTYVTDPDISRLPSETVNHSSVPEPQPRESSKEGDQPSPVSVLEASYDDDDVSSSSECFESVSADLKGLRMQLQLLKLESAAYNEASMLVSTDEDTDQESSTITDEILTSQEAREEDWKPLYLVDLLNNSRLSDSDHITVMETPVDPSLFQDLEKKYSSLKTSTRLERKFLFDEISRELIQILKTFSDPHPWVKPKRVCQKWDANKIQETLHDLVTRKEERASKDDVEEWLILEDDIEIIGRDIEEMLTDELIAELVVDAIF